jgi:hypothetical protein
MWKPREGEKVKWATGHPLPEAPPLQPQAQRMHGSPVSCCRVASALWSRSTSYRRRRRRVLTSGRDPVLFLDPTLYHHPHHRPTLQKRPDRDAKVANWCARGPAHTEETPETVCGCATSPHQNQSGVKSITCAVWLVGGRGTRQGWACACSSEGFVASRCATADRSVTQPCLRCIGSTVQIYSPGRG